MLLFLSRRLPTSEKIVTAARILHSAALRGYKGKKGYRKYNKIVIESVERFFYIE
jgi:hypothetical protein